MGNVSFFSYDYDALEKKGFCKLSNKKNRYIICKNNDDMKYIKGKENLFKYDFEYLNGRVLYI